VSLVPVRVMARVRSEGERAALVKRIKHLLLTDPLLTMSQIGERMGCSRDFVRKVRDSFPEMRNCRRDRGARADILTAEV
jgi:hypothetical protein